jgi:hypothetical protein
MASGSTTRRWRPQFSLRTLLLLAIPVALATSFAIRLFRQPVDVAISVDRISRFDTVDNNGSPVLALGAQVSAVNRSRHTVWYLENTRYFLFEYVDGKWEYSWPGTSLDGAPGKELWSAQGDMQSTSIVVPLSEEATAIKIGVVFSADKSGSRPHWVFTPTVKVVKQGQDYSPEVVARNANDVRLESAFEK